MPGALESPKILARVSLHASVQGAGTPRGCLGTGSGCNNPALTGDFRLLPGLISSYPVNVVSPPTSPSYVADSVARGLDQARGHQILPTGIYLPLYTTPGVNNSELG